MEEKSVETGLFLIKKIMFGTASVPVSSITPEMQKGPASIHIHPSHPLFPASSLGKKKFHVFHNPMRKTE